MCGIFAILSQNKQNDILLKCVNSLKKLEYRGYDSSGIGFIENEAISFVKKKGKIINLKENLPKDKSVNLAISHTRWATHGKPSDINSHPHISNNGKLAIVHNGIIENYATLKKKLISEGYHFQSETDTEVFINFIEYINLQNKENTFEENLQSCLKYIEGAYGAIIINLDFPDKLFVLKKGSPISLGISNDSVYISSDYYSFAEYTNSVLNLNDNELAIIKNLNVKIMNFNDNTIINPIFTKLDITLNQLEKDTFSHFMLKEIMNQSQSISDCLRGRISKDLENIKLGGLDTLYNGTPIIDHLKNAEKILICACGTSFHSGLLGKYIIEELADISVEVEQASEFRYRKHVLPKNTIVIAISQSGETADTLEAIRICKKKGFLTLGICNVVGSTISRETDGGIYLHIGPEIGVASTKAFTGQIVVLYLIALKLALLKNINKDKVLDGIKDLSQLSEKIKYTIEKNKEYTQYLGKIFKYSQNFLFLGRGFNYPVALEGALKLKEISYIHAEGYSAAEMKHGPIALIDNMMPVVIICIKDNIYYKVKSNLEEVKARGGSLIIITNESNDELDELSNIVIKIPEVKEYLYPFLTIIPLQLMSYYIALERGCNVDQPRNLAKCVTVE